MCILGGDIGYGCWCATSLCYCNLTFHLDLVTVSHMARKRKLIVGRVICFGDVGVLHLIVTLI